ncbi:hypothetical protein L484_013163 [Morus notabilis]|uniref:SAM domain-containing protein n=1 Tax=Morus notabilis TaxID=981085 RepID=W9RM77_9ROSA|nr:uncharacterized protein LOC21396347 [Morus notabilis]EXB81222.1 hypothetical protein L484_013163 [Morus notabilis]
MADDLLQPAITTIPSPQPPPPPTAIATATTAPPSSSENHPAGPPLAPKRQRRPSVRLGEIGDQPAATQDSQHLRRPKYKFPKDNNSFSKAAAATAAVKARSLTNLVNGNGNTNTTDYSHETLIPDQNGGDAANFELGGARRPAKAKRPTTKRARSSWVSSSKAADGDSEDDGFRDTDNNQADSESPMKENSPIQSLENGAFGLWNDGGGGDGVRTWLIELGLSRYAPVFEIHEVDDDVLPLLTLEDLKDMGINAVGSRRKMYNAIQKLRKGFS